MSALELLASYRRRLRDLKAMETFPIQQEGVVFACPLDSGRRRNLALQHVNKSLLHRAEVSLPHIVHVGVTTLCNLRCPACPTGTKALGRPGEHLDYGVYERVVQELGGTLMFLLFWDWGEPLMHPRLPDMIRLASARRIKTVISTNGTVANSEQQIERLVAAQPSLIICCVDGATQQSYEKYRVGGRLSKVLDTIRRLVAAREALGTAYPIVEFRTLATKYNEGEMSALLDLADETGADFFSLKTLRPFDYRGRDVDDELVPLSAELARYAYAGDDLGAGGRVYAGGSLRCGKPIYAPTLNSDGHLAFCSYAGFEEEFFGDVSARGFKRLWRSRNARRKRLDFLRSEGTRSCEKCFFRTDHKPTILYTVPLRPLPPDVSLMRSDSRESLLELDTRTGGRADI